MILWRVSNHATLDGSGGLRASGRWHSVGQRIVYCAPNPATALLEILVHASIDLEDLPVNFQYLEVEVPDATSIDAVDTQALSGNWQTDPAETRRYGDAWLQSARTALLRVPSVIVPATWNVLVNPRHPDSAKIRVARVHRHVMDRRLLE